MSKGDSVITMKVPDGTSRTATFKVASSVKEIEAFYAEQFEIKMSMLSDEGGTLIAQPGDKRTVTIVVDSEDDDGLRAVTVSVVEEK